MKYVQFVRGHYTVRVTVPTELRAIIRKRELIENLGADKKIAERRAHGVIAGFLAIIEEAKERLVASKPTLSGVAKTYYRSQLDADDGDRLKLGQEIVAGMNEETLAIMATYTRLAASGQLPRETAKEWVGGMLDTMRHNSIAPDTPSDELLKALARVELDVLAVIDARDKNAIAQPDPRSELLTLPEPSC